MSDPTGLYLPDLADPGAMTERLVHAGLSPAAAGAKADLFADVAQGLLETDTEDEHPLRAFYVPGRIEVLGKHTDYAGGSSVLAAAEVGFCLAAAAREDDTVRLLDVGYGEKTEFRIGPDLAPTAGHWSNYPMTVARRIARNFPGPIRGMDIVLTSDLPPAAGMSSSSALMVAFFHALAAVNGLAERAEYRENIDSTMRLAEYLGTVENGQTFGTLAGDKGVGTFGGSEDHTAMLCCQAGVLSQYAYCPTRFEGELPLPRGYVFAIAASGVIAEKTGEAMARYNRASRLAAAAAEVWRAGTGRDDPHLQAALASGPSALPRMRDMLARARVEDFSPDELTARFEAFHAENHEIIPAAGQALRNLDLGEFGRQVDLSQECTETLLGNQVPETVFLAHAARDLGAAAASAFGAGFGGSVWALVEQDAAEDFLTHWAESYLRAHEEPAQRASFFLTAPGPAAFEVE